MVYFILSDSDSGFTIISRIISSLGGITTRVLWNRSRVTLLMEYLLKILRQSIKNVYYMSSNN